MQLMSCVECGKQLSSEDSICSHCDTHFEKLDCDDTIKKLGNKRGKEWIKVGLFLLAFRSLDILGIGEYSSDVARIIELLIGIAGFFIFLRGLLLTMLSI